MCNVNCVFEGISWTTVELSNVCKATMGKRAGRQSVDPRYNKLCGEMRIRSSQRVTGEDVDPHDGDGRAVYGRQ